MEDVVDANVLNNVDLEILLSRCANCHFEFANKTATITEICGKYPIIVGNSCHMLNDKSMNEIEATGYPITVLEAVSSIYGFPLERRKKLDEWMWRKEDDCVLCKKCAKIVTTFYDAYQELQMLAHKASYISKGLQQLHNCVQKTFSDGDNDTTETKREKRNCTNKQKPYRSHHTREKQAISVSSHKSPSNDLEKDKSELEEHVQEGENHKDKESRFQHDTDGHPIELEIVKVETLLSEQCEKDANIKKVEVPFTQEEETGTREIVSADGRIIRSSTRTRKIKTLVHFGNSPSSARNVVKDATGRRRSNRNGENIDQQKSTIKEPAISTNVSNLNDMDSVLWEFCNDLYYKETNLATLKDGRFICPDAKCGKTFKGLKTLNKHSLVHDLNRTYHCSKCDKVFLSRQQIKLHVQQVHIAATTLAEMPSKNSSNEATELTEDCLLLNSNKNTAHSSGSSKQLKKTVEIESLKTPETFTKTNNTSLKAEKQYKCEHCDKIYLLKRTYEKHLASHDKQGVMCRCTVCDQTFHTALSLARHITCVHDANDKGLPLDYSCPQCPQSESSFENYNELKLHFEKTHKSSLNFCKKCGKSFTTLHHLRRHHQNVHKEQLPDDIAKIGEESQAVNNDKLNILDGDSHENIIPQNSFDKNSEPGEIKRGAAKTNSNVKKLFCCTKCNKTFKRKNQLNLHTLFHNEAIPRFGCSKCPKKFFQPNSLRTHMLVHSMKNPLLCKKCDKVFERRDHFKRHVEVVHSKIRTKKTTSTAHTCLDCNKTFSRKEYLRLHMRIHTGERPHVCEICSKQFRDPRNLAQHLVTHKTERPFCCSVCGLTFKRAHHLNDHEGTHRQNIARPFVCPVAYCGKAFKLRKHLVSHELVHLGSKDHTCHVCGRAFSRKDNLRQHINKLHGKKLADELLIVVEEQRERYRQNQLDEHQKSTFNAEHNEEIILEHDATLADSTATVPLASLGQETAMVGTADSIQNFIGENGPISQVLQIIPTDVVTTIAVPLSSIVATLSPTNSFTNFSYS